MEGKDGGEEKLKRKEREERGKRGGRRMPPHEPIFTGATIKSLSLAMHASHVFIDLTLQLVNNYALTLQYNMQPYALV